MARNSVEFRAGGRHCDLARMVNLDDRLLRLAALVTAALWTLAAIRAAVWRRVIWKGSRGKRWRASLKEEVAAWPQVTLRPLTPLETDIVFQA